MSIIVVLLVIPLITLSTDNLIACPVVRDGLDTEPVTIGKLPAQASLPNGTQVLLGVL